MCAGLSACQTRPSHSRQGEHGAQRPTYRYNRTCFAPLALPAAVSRHPSATQEYATEPADSVDPLLSQPVRGDARRHPLRARRGQELPDRAEDLLGPAPCPLEAEPVQLVGNLDDTARIDQVIGRVDDAAVGEQLVDAGPLQLVVGAAADDLVRGGILA